MIADFGGLSNVMPNYATLFMIVTLSSIGLPMLNGFIGEFLILVGAFKNFIPYAAFAAVGIVLGAAYMLWLYQRAMFGKCENPDNQVLKDLNAREMMTLLPIIFFCFWIGIYPTPFFNFMSASINHLIQTMGL
jgi:NADH-quinone oxidoreductase subunit M